MFGLFRRQEVWPIRAGRVTLRPMRTPDVEQIRGWFSDPELLRLAFGTQADAAALDKMARDYCKEMDAGRNSALSVDSLGGELIGFVRFGLRSNHRGRVARVGILIGSRRHWNQGLGTEAMAGLLIYLFERRGVHFVELDTADFNHRARRCFEKCGFRLLVLDPEPGELYPTHAHGEPTGKIWMEVSRISWERWRQASTGAGR